MQVKNGWHYYNLVVALVKKISESSGLQTEHGPKQWFGSEWRLDWIKRNIIFKKKCQIMESNYFALLWFGQTSHWVLSTLRRIQQNWNGFRKEQ